LNVLLCSYINNPIYYRFNFLYVTFHIGIMLPETINYFLCSIFLRRVSDKNKITKNNKRR